MARIKRLVTLTAVIALAVLMLAVVRSSGARFVAASENEGSLLSAARIDLTLGSPERLRFDARGAYPGVVMERCIVVTYRGTGVPSLVRLHGAVVGGTGLDASIDVTVDTGSGGSNGHCDGFAPSGDTYYHDTLAGLAADHGDFAHGVAQWRAASAGASQVYRVRVEVLDDANARGRSTNFELRWEVEAENVA